MDIFQIMLIAVIAWLFVLSGVFLWLFLKLVNLIKSSDSKNLASAFDKVFKLEKENEKRIKNLEVFGQKLAEEDLFHIQKVGLVRFNPFNETGGDQSFSLSLLDGKDNGLVITGLHTRERTRLYLKPVKSGKSGYELSKEELKALQKASKLKDYEK